MPMSNRFSDRLQSALPAIAEHFGTPFHIYDEAGIRETCRLLQRAFAGVEGFREYFAVKALPNPAILRIVTDEGFGFDCSSGPELTLARQTGARGDDIFYTSNNTTRDEFVAAMADGGAILNLDSVDLLQKLPRIPVLISFRYNPGALREGNAIIGNPIEAKFGIADADLEKAYMRARSMGVKRFGLHAMIVSNERDYHSMAATTDMLLKLAARLKTSLGINLEFINIGGGLGIPYHPDHEPLDVFALGQEAMRLLDAFAADQGYKPRLLMESGRYITGPHGVLVTKVINIKQSYRRYIGVDASMPALMRPGMYGAYHHISIFDKADPKPLEEVDVVGALCENNDKFAVQRALPPISEGDLLLIHDTGAHGHSMGFNYNARLRPQELLLREDGQVQLIRRAETEADYFATLQYTPDVLSLSIVD